MRAEYTFAGQLKDFARSVDNVDAETFDGVRALVVGYTQSFGAQYFELLTKDVRGQNGDEEVWLRRFWSSDDDRRSGWRVRTPDGGFTNPITQAFAMHKPMWIVGQNDTALDEAEYVDLWSHTCNHPRYNVAGAQHVKTLIIVPMCTRHEYGALYVEFPKRLLMTDVSMRDFKLLADALEILYALFEHDEFRANNKRGVLWNLRSHLREAQFPRTAVPHMFMAYPGKADPEVRQCISVVVAEFGDRLEITDWDRMFASGDITAQISKEIAVSTLGLCYFSEPTQTPTEHLFEDNPNVVFEAGMLQARISAFAGDTSGQPIGWIPIREMDSPEPPFDFAAERILYVPRDARGSLRETKFEDLLRQRIQMLLGESATRYAFTPA